MDLEIRLAHSLVSTEPSIPSQCRDCRQCRPSLSKIVSDPHALAQARSTNPDSKWRTSFSSHPCPCRSWSILRYLLANQQEGREQVQSQHPFQNPPVSISKAVGVTITPNCLDAILLNNVDSLEMVLLSVVAVDVGCETCESKRILLAALPTNHSTSESDKGISMLATTRNS
jgi:hypothetical protein